MGYRDRGYLPHLELPESIFFVTFRLAGTLPQKVLNDFRMQRQTIAAIARKQNRKLSYQEELRLKYLESINIQKYLDQGIGDCRAGLCNTWEEWPWTICSKSIQASLNRKDIQKSPPEAGVTKR